MDRCRTRRGQDAKRLIDGIQQTHPFDDRYARVEKLDWESCAKVLSATDMQKVLAVGWYPCGRPHSGETCSVAGKA